MAKNNNVPHGQHLNTAIEGFFKALQCFWSHPIGQLLTVDIAATIAMLGMTERDKYQHDMLIALVLPIRAAYLIAATAPAITPLASMLLESKGK